MAKIRGRVRKFGDNIDTDTITPGSSLHLPIEKIKQHAFEPIAPGFSGSVKEGDVIVAGENFGCGSSREQATSVVKELGIRHILCDSMARIYFRNCVALGLYPIVSKGVSAIFNEGDEIEIDFGAKLLTNPITAKAVYFEPLSGIIKEIIESGGIINLLKSLT